MSSNPFQEWFHRVDAVVPELGKREDSLSLEAGDLLKRAAYVLAITINANAQAYPALVYTPEPGTEDTEGTSLNQPQDADSEVHSTT